MGDRTDSVCRFSGLPTQVNVRGRGSFGKEIGKKAATRLGWELYSHVATRTTTDPRRNVDVIWKLKRATDARNEMTILKLVAKPFKILSEYLITIAVSSPPRTWTATVTHAQGPKFWNNSGKKLPIPLVACAPYVTMMGANAGKREKSDSWTFRTQRWPGSFSKPFQSRPQPGLR